jgi:hypothetical protein
MPTTDPAVSRRLMRLARRIHHRVESAAEPSHAPIPRYEWERLLKLDRYLELSKARGWRSALPRLQRDYIRTVQTLVHHAEANLQALHAEADRRPVASVRDILADLIALQSEFGGLEVDLKLGNFSVVTEAIELEGVWLGRFRIVVLLDCLGEASPYEIVALDPNPASESSETVHPHVQGDSLCEGEGRAAIRKASQQGRVYDLCVLIRQILETYNSGSAYVPLSRWANCPCEDCGTSVGSGESTFCHRCESDLCQDCAIACGDCQENVCVSCRSQCQSCSSTYCDHCFQTCDRCGNQFCSECLDEGRCSSCQETEETLDEETLEESVEGKPAEVETAVETVAAVHALGVGEVPVPA